VQTDVLLVVSVKTSGLVDSPFDGNLTGESTSDPSLKWFGHLGCQHVYHACCGSTAVVRRATSRAGTGSSVDVVATLGGPAGSGIARRRRGDCQLRDRPPGRGARQLDTGLESTAQQGGHRL